MTRQGARIHVKAIFSPTSMHGAFLRDESCPKVRIQTYGYSQAKGGLSEEFKNDLDSNVLVISSVEYDVDLTGIIERDEDGLWVRALSVLSYEIKGGGGK